MESVRVEPGPSRYVENRIPWCLLDESTKLLLQSTRHYIKFLKTEARFIAQLVKLRSSWKTDFLAKMAPYFRSHVILALFRPQEDLRCLKKMIQRILSMPDAEVWSYPMEQGMWTWLVHYFVIGRFGTHPKELYRVVNKIKTMWVREIYLL